MNFTYDWFYPIIPTLERALKPIANQALKALEIGSFEGRSTTWFLENILTHPESSITCVDHFLGGSDHAELNLEGLQGRFRANIEPWQSKVQVVPESSWVALLTFPSDSFDFTFVDGSHESHDVLYDAVQAYRVTKPNGLILFDDYGWGMDRKSRPGVGIDAFLSAFSSKITVIEKAYSVVIRKL